MTTKRHQGERGMNVEHTIGMAYPGTVITHVVLLTLNDPADRDEAVTRLSQLPESIPEIASLQVGTDTVGTDGASDIVLITTHGDSSSLAAYQSHTVHQEFLNWIRPRLASRAVVDTENLSTIELSTTELGTSEPATEPAPHDTSGESNED